MKSKAMQINELRLRVPGLSPEEGRQLGEMVGAGINRIRISETSRPRRIRSLHIVADAKHGASIGGMAEEIVAKIEREIK